MFDTTRIKTLDVFSFDVKGEPKGLGFVINGKPYMLWTHVYQNLEMVADHASRVIKRLNASDYFYVTRGEIASIFSGFDSLSMPVLHNAPGYYLLSEKGFNRAIMEVDTSGMKDRKIAAAIEKRKDEMAHIFTEYKNGTLALPAGKKPRSRKSMDVKSFTPISPVLKDYLSAGRSIGLDKRTATLKAIEMTEKKTGEDLSTYKECVPALPAKTRGVLYSSTAIAEKFGKHSKVSNQFMAENGLLIKIGREWGLTVLGEKYGEMEAITITSGKGSRTNYAPRWKPDVIEYLKKKNPVKGQKTLN